jgi:hypothetical protein
LGDQHDVDGLSFGIEDDLCLAPLQLPRNLRHFLIERDVPLAIFRTFAQYEGLEYSAQGVLRKLRVGNDYRFGGLGGLVSFSQVTLS